MSDEIKKENNIFDIQRDTLKNVVKEAFKEWIDEKVHEASLSIVHTLFKLFIGSVVFIIFYAYFLRKGS